MADRMAADQEPADEAESDPEPESESDPAAEAARRRAAAAAGEPDGDPAEAELHTGEGRFVDARP
ncbi:hypothetical protein ACFW95_05440, partial [Streptomyces sp. NPDC059474]